MSTDQERLSRRGFMEQALSMPARALVPRFATPMPRDLAVSATPGDGAPPTFTSLTVSADSANPHLRPQDSR